MAPRKPVPPIPDVPANTPNELRALLQALVTATRVRTGQTPDKLEAAVTMRDLVDNQLLEELPGGGARLASGISGAVAVYVGRDPFAYDTPPVPTEVEARSVFDTVVLTYRGFDATAVAAVEIWRNQGADVLADAVLLGSSNSLQFWDSNVTTGETYYYWVRTKIVVGGTTYFSPFHSQSGASATVSASLESVTSSLEGQVDEFFFTPDFLARLDLIDGAAGIPGSVNERISNLENTLNGVIATTRGDLEADLSALNTTLGGQITLAKNDAVSIANAYTNDRELAILLSVDQAETDAIAAAQSYTDGVQTALESLISAETTARQTALGGVNDSISDINSAIADLQGTPAFDSATSYAVDDTFSYGGSLYRVVSATTAPSPTPPNAAYELIGNYDSISAAVADHSSQLAINATRLDSIYDPDTDSGLVKVLQDDVTLLKQNVGDVTQTAYSSLSQAITSQDGAIQSVQSDVTLLRTRVGGNLLSAGAAGTTSSSADGPFRSERHLLADLDLVEGDVISYSADLRATAPRTMQLCLWFLDATEGVVGPVYGGYSGSPTWERRALEDVTVPANVAEIVVCVENDTAGSGALGEVRRLMLNRGAEAAPYDDPRATVMAFDSLSSEVETIDDKVVALDQERVTLLEAKVGDFDAAVSNSLFQQVSGITEDGGPIDLLQGDVALLKAQVGDFDAAVQGTLLQQLEDLSGEGGPITLNQDAITSLRASVGTNLMPFDTSAEMATSGNQIYSTGIVPLSEFGLEPGDIISASADVRSDAPRPAGIWISPRDATDAQIGPAPRDQQSSTTYVRTKIEDWTIPAGCESLVVLVIGEAGAGAIYARRLMLNRGPVALPFELPRAAADAVSALSQTITTIDGRVDTIEQTNLVSLQNQINDRVTQSVFEQLENEVNGLTDPGGTIEAIQSDVSGLSQSVGDISQTAFTSVEQAIVEQGVDITSTQDQLTLLRQSVGENLLPPEAEEGGSSPSAGWSFVLTLTLAELGLAAGDVISASAEVKNDVPRGQQFVIQFSDGSRAGAPLNYAADWERVVVEGVTVPADVTSLSIGGDNYPNDNGTAIGYIRRMMLNRGPAAYPFARPRATASALSSLSTTVETMGDEVERIVTEDVTRLSLSVSDNLMPEDAEDEYQTEDQLWSKSWYLVLADLGLFEGDVVSFSADVSADPVPGGGNRSGRMYIRWYNASDVQIGGPMLGSVWEDVLWGRTLLENVIIPAGAAKVSVAVDADNGHFNQGLFVRHRRVTMNRGPVALPFARPRASAVAFTQLYNAYTAQYTPGGAIALLQGSTESLSQDMGDISQTAYSTVANAIIDQDNSISGAQTQINALRQSVGTNLLPSAATNESMTTFIGWAKTFNLLLADLGLSEGDVISFSGESKVEGTQRTQALIQFWTADNTRIGSFGSGYEAFADWTRQEVQDITIPPNAVRISVGIDNDNDQVGQPGYGRKLMLNRGPVALPFERPVATLSAFDSITTRVEDAEGDISSSITRLNTLESDVYQEGTGLLLLATKAEMTTLRTDILGTAVDDFSQIKLRFEQVDTAIDSKATVSDITTAVSTLEEGKVQTNIDNIAAIEGILEAPKNTALLEVGGVNAIRGELTSLKNGAVAANTTAVNTLSAELTRNQQGGGALHTAWATDDLEKWTFLGGFESAEIVDDDPGFPGLSGAYIRVTDNDDTVEEIRSKEAAPIDPTKGYEAEVWVRQPVGDRRAYIFLDFLDASGSRIVANTPSGSDYDLSWRPDGNDYPYPTASGTLFYFGVTGNVPAPVWTKHRVFFGADLGPNQGPIIPAHARYLRIGILPTRSSFAGENVVTTFEFGSFRVTNLPDALATRAQVIETAVNNDITGLQATYTMASAVHAEVFDEATGQRSLATLDELDQAKADVKGASVSEFSQINAQFGVVEGELAKGESLVSTLTDPEHGGESWSIPAGGVIGTVTHDGRTLSCLQFSAIAHTVMNAEPLPCGPNDIFEVSVTGWFENTGRYYFGMYAGDDTVVGAAFAATVPDLTDPRYTRGISYDASTDTVTPGPFNSGNSYYVGSRLGESAWVTMRGYVFGPEVDPEVARGLLPQNLKESTLVAFQLQPGATRFLVRVLSGWDIAAGTQDVYLGPVTVRKLTETDAFAHSASVTRVSEAKSDIFSASVTDFTGIDAVVNDPVTGLGSKASSQDLIDAKTEIYSADITQFTGIDAVVNDPVTGLQSKASSQDVLDAKTEVYTANITEFSGINAVVNDPVTGLSQRALQSTVNQSLVDLEEAFSSSINGVVASIGGNLLDPAIDKLYRNTRTMPAGSQFGPADQQTLQELGLAVGDVLSISGEVLGENQNLRMVIEAWNGSGWVGPVAVAVPDSALPNAWTYIEASGAIPSGTTYLRFFMANESAVKNEVYGRNMMVNRGSVALPYERAAARASAVEVLESSVSQIEGTDLPALQARHGVRLDVNGYVTGFVQNNDGQQGSFIVLADQFGIRRPDGGGATAFPFLVSDGVVYLDTAVIGLASITDAQIDYIDAETITTGTLATDRLKIDNLTLTADGNGNLIISQGGVDTTNLAANAVSELAVSSRTSTLSVPANTMTVLETVDQVFGSVLAAPQFLVSWNIVTDGETSGPPTVTIQVVRKLWFEATPAWVNDTVVHSVTATLNQDFLSGSFVDAPGINDNGYRYELRVSITKAKNVYAGTGISMTTLKR